MKDCRYHVSTVSSCKVLSCTSVEPRKPKALNYTSYSPRIARIHSHNSQNCNGCISKHIETYQHNRIENVIDTTTNSELDNAFRCLQMKIAKPPYHIALSHEYFWVTPPIFFRASHKNIYFLASPRKYETLVHLIFWVNMPIYSPLCPMEIYPCSCLYHYIH